jgi:hypothetical protein
MFAERYAGNSNAGLREGLVFFRHLTRLALTSRARAAESDGPALKSATAPGLPTAAVKVP